MEIGAVPPNYDRQYVTKRVRVAPPAPLPPSKPVASIMSNWQRAFANTYSAVIKAQNEKMNNLQPTKLDEERPKQPAGPIIAAPVASQLNDATISPISNAPLNTSPAPANPTPIPISGPKHSDTATLTPQEFSQGKGAILATNTDVHISDQEKEHAATGDDQLAPLVGSDKDANPATPYSAPVGPNETPENPKPTSAKLKPAQANPNPNPNPTPATEKDKGLLGVGGLLSTAALVYGTSEGLSSQYMVGAAAVAAYCLTHVLDLKL